MQETILDWYEQHARELPRREETDPYKIRVSEVMSQQTQVARVITKYEEWLTLLPTIQDLAWVSKKTLLTLWSWLGYNNRALRLQKAAQIVVEEYAGQVPRSEKELLDLPGIWPYTAHAIMAFAYNAEVPVLDINIKRVLITMLHLPKESTDKQLRDIAIACIPAWQSKVRHNALMDYGALVLHSKKTGIKSAKQSTFKWSRRWVRWSIIKKLTKQEKLEKEAVRAEFKHKDFDTILMGMQKDWLILVSWWYITLQS